MSSSRSGVMLLHEWHVEVRKRVRRRVLVEEADWRRVWKSAVRRIDGWTRFLSRLSGEVEN